MVPPWADGEDDADSVDSSSEQRPKRQSRKSCRSLAALRMKRSLACSNLETLERDLDGSSHSSRGLQRAAAAVHAEPSADVLKEEQAKNRRNRRSSTVIGTCSGFSEGMAPEQMLSEQAESSTLVNSRRSTRAISAGAGFHFTKARSFHCDEPNAELGHEVARGGHGEDGMEAVSARMDLARSDALIDQHERSNNEQPVRSNCAAPDMSVTRGSSSAASAQESDFEADVSIQPSRLQQPAAPLSPSRADSGGVALEHVPLTHPASPPASKFQHEAREAVVPTPLFELDAAAASSCEVTKCRPAASRTQHGADDGTTNDLGRTVSLSWGSCGNSGPRTSPAEISPMLDRDKKQETLDTPSSQPASLLEAEGDLGVPSKRHVCVPTEPADASTTRQTVKAGQKQSWKKTMQLTVISASGLPSRRNALGFGGDVDPFCVCERLCCNGSRQEVLRTQAVNSCLCPVWEHTVELCNFEVDSRLVFRVYDKDVWTDDDLLGSVCLSSEAFFSSGLDAEVPLELPEPRRCSSVSAATLKLRIDVSAASASCSSSLGDADAARVDTPRVAGW